MQQSGLFSRRVKKLHADEKSSLDNAVKIIMGDPTIGQMKTGDLSGVHIYKYKHKSQEYLLAYRFVKDEMLLTLLAIGNP